MGHRTINARCVAKWGIAQMCLCEQSTQPGLVQESLRPFGPEVSRECPRECPPRSVQKVSTFLRLCDILWALFGHSGVRETPCKTLLRKILVSAILGPEMAAPILWTPGKNAFFLQENPHVHKIPRFRGGGGYFGFGGGGSADFIFFWARGFFWTPSDTPVFLGDLSGTLPDTSRPRDSLASGGDP